MVTTNPIQHHYYYHHHHHPLILPTDPQRSMRPLSTFRYEQPLERVLYSFFHPLSHSLLLPLPLPLKFSQQRRTWTTFCWLLFSFVYTWERRHASLQFSLKSIFLFANSRSSQYRSRRRAYTRTFQTPRLLVSIFRICFRNIFANTFFPLVRYLTSFRIHEYSRTRRV